MVCAVDFFQPEPPVEQLFQDSSIIHSHYVSDPSHLVKNDPLFDAKRASSFQNSGIRRERGPVNLHDTPKTILVEPLQAFDVTPVVDVSEPYSRHDKTHAL